MLWSCLFLGSGSAVMSLVLVPKVAGMMAQVAHVTGEVQFPKTEDGRVDLGWAAGQVATTADFSHGSWFWMHFTGGLNYQVCPLPGRLTHTDIQAFSSSQRFVQRTPALAKPGHCCK